MLIKRVQVWSIQTIDSITANCTLSGSIPYEVIYNQKVGTDLYESAGFLE